MLHGSVKSLYCRPNTHVITLYVSSLELKFKLKKKREREAGWYNELGRSGDQLLSHCTWGRQRENYMSFSECLLPSHAQLKSHAPGTSMLSRSVCLHRHAKKKGSRGLFHKNKSTNLPFKHQIIQNCSQRNFAKRSKSQIFGNMPFLKMARSRNIWVEC